MVLHEVISALYASEINCRVSSGWDAGVDLFIGDEQNGYDEKTLVLAIQGWEAEAAEWLHDAAIRCYPDSAYALSAEGAKES